MGGGGGAHKHRLSRLATPQSSIAVLTDVNPAATSLQLSHQLGTPRRELFCGRTGIQLDNNDRVCRVRVDLLSPEAEAWTI